MGYAADVAKLFSRTLDALSDSLLDRGYGVVVELFNPSFELHQSSFLLEGWRFEVG